MNSYNKFNILASQIIQAGILNQEEFKSEKDKRTILRKKKEKK